MPRLNNKDFTVEELERLIYLLNKKMDQKKIMGEGFDGIDCEVSGLLKGTTLQSPDELHGSTRAIEWGFKFILVMPPMNDGQSVIIRNAMRSVEVNETIKDRFTNIVYEELNRYNDQVRVLMLKGGTNVLE
jgi:hypothetical protein